MPTIAFAATLAVTSACSEKPTAITPWFELEKSAPLIDLPHAFQTSDYKEIVRVRVNGTWKQVLDVRGRLGFRGIWPVAFEGGQAVLVNPTIGRDTLIFREGVEQPAALTHDDCFDPYLRDNWTFVCTRAETAQGTLANHFGDRVASVRIDTFDSSAARVDRQHVSVPEAYAGAISLSAHLVGWDSRGLPIIEASSRDKRDPLYGVCAALVLDPAGAREVARVAQSSRCPDPRAWQKLVAEATVLSPDAPMPLVQGTWAFDAMVGGPPRKEPENKSCKVFMKLDPEGKMTATSGEQVMSGLYAVERRRDGFYLVVRDASMNDKANCRGEAPATQEKVKALRVEVEGDRLKLYAPMPTVFISYRKQGT